MELWEQALVLLLLMMTVLVILLIPTAVNLLKILSKVSKTVDELNKELPAILENVSEITDNASEMSTKIHGSVDNLVELEKKVSFELKGPVLETLATVVGVLQGIQTFMTFIMKKK